MLQTILPTFQLIQSCSHLLIINYSSAFHRTCLLLIHTLLLQFDLGLIGVLSFSHDSMFIYIQCIYLTLFCTLSNTFNEKHYFLPLSLCVRSTGNKSCCHQCHITTLALFVLLIGKPGHICHLCLPRPVLSNLYKRLIESK